MSRSVDVTDIISAARSAADMDDSEFVSDAEELIPLLNTYYAELRDLLIAAFGPAWFADSYTFNTVSGTGDYEWPDEGGEPDGDGSDFYLLLGVDVEFSSNDVVSAKPYSFFDRNEYATTHGWGGRGPVYYRVHGQTICLRPVPDGAYQVTIHYVPACPVLDTEDSIDGINGFERYIIVCMAIAMLDKEESDTSVLQAEKASLTRRIQSMGQQRDAGGPKRMTMCRQGVFSRAGRL